MHRLIDRINLYFRKLHAYRITRDELHRMTRRELADIGIAPYEIPDIARQSFEQTT